MASEIEAAERYGRFMAMQMGATEHADYCMGQMCTDRDSLARWAVARLAADRAEQEERERPIDAEWLESIGGVNCSGGWDEKFRFGNIEICKAYPRKSWSIEGGIRVDATERKPLVDLLCVLKGGAE